MSNKQKAKNRRKVYKKANNILKHNLKKAYFKGQRISKRGAIDHLSDIRNAQKEIMNKN